MQSPRSFETSSSERPQGACGSRGGPGSDEGSIRAPVAMDSAAPCGRRAGSGRGTTRPHARPKLTRAQARERHQRAHASLTWLLAMVPSAATLASPADDGPRFDAFAY